MGEVELDIEMLSKRLDERVLAQVTSPTKTLHGGKINKVQWRLRDVNAKSYEPEMVAIGPYHHGKDKLKAMEELKLHYFHILVLRKPHQKMNYLSEIAEIEKDARAFYSEDIGLDQAEFIEMLVLDGCFIIELIGGFKGNEHTTNIPTRLRDSLHHDLVLLENQIPFFVLRKLFGLIEGQGKDQLLMNRVLSFCKDVFPGNILYKSCRKADQVKHILDLVHSNWYPPEPWSSFFIPSDEENVEQENVEQASSSSILIRSAVQQKDANVKFELKEYDTDSEQGILVQVSSPSILIPSAVQQKDANDEQQNDAQKNVEQDSWSSFFIPSAVQLKDANVKFKLKKYDGVSEHEFRENKGTTLFDVEFRKNKGVVLMPGLVIDDETESLLRNLIAYEQYFSETERTPVTDYALLLDSLINNAEDV